MDGCVCKADFYNLTILFSCSRTKTCGSTAWRMLEDCFKGIQNYNKVGEPIPKRQILDSSKLKDFADDNLEFDEYDRKLSKQVENTVGKGEIAHNEEFLLILQCFQKTYISNM